MVACAILRDRCFALDALSNEQIPRDSSIDSLFDAGVVMPRFATLEAGMIATLSAECLSLAAASWASQHSLTVSCRAPLQVLILADQDVLVDRFKDFQLLFSQEWCHFIETISFRAASLHALERDSFT